VDHRDTRAVVEGEEMRIRTSMAFSRSVTALVVLLYVVGLGAAPASSAVPSLSVDPATQLVDLQFVTVTGSGFTSGPTITLIECVDSDLNRCDPFTYRTTAADSSGRFQSSFRVRRQFRTSAVLTTPDDCAVVACTIVAMNIQNIAERATVPLAFDPKQPPLLYEPSVDRKAELTDGGFSIHITGTLRCTQPFGIGIEGHLDQTDRSDGYPFQAFAQCNRKTSWSATVAVSPTDQPFEKGHAQVQAIAFGPGEDPQVGTIENVTMVER
jgi:hypothetical protein